MNNTIITKNGLNKIDLASQFAYDRNISFMSAIQIINKGLNEGYNLDEIEEIIKEQTK